MQATLRALLLAAVGAVALAVPAVAQTPFQQGLDASKPGDDATAFQSFYPLAEQGNAAAQFNIAVMYSNGRGVQRNDAEALRWYRMAAEQGETRAQTSLGLMYHTGVGAPKNDAEAVKWSRLAADQGFALAQGQMGVMYWNGEGVPENYVEAYKWFALSAAQGNAMAKQGRDLLRDKMTPAQIAEAQKLAAEWKPTK